MLSVISCFGPYSVDHTWIQVRTAAQHVYADNRSVLCRLPDSFFFLTKMRMSQFCNRLNILFKKKKLFLEAIGSSLQPYDTNMKERCFIMAMWKKPLPVGCVPHLCVQFKIFSQALFCCFSSGRNGKTKAGWFWPAWQPLCSSPTSFSWLEWKAHLALHCAHSQPWLYITLCFRRFAGCWWRPLSSFLDCTRICLSWQEMSDCSQLQSSAGVGKT